MSDILDISNVIRVTVTTPLRGLPSVNTSALALITDDVPVVPNYGDYRVYRNPTGPGLDFGTNSNTARIANVVFGQTPNIITGGGFLIIIPRDASAAAAPATILSSGVVDFTQLAETDYEINLDVGAGPAADVTIGSIDATSLATIQSSLNSTEITAAGIEFLVSGQTSAANVTMRTTATGASASVDVGTASTGTDIAGLIKISGSATGADAGVERVKDAILRTITAAAPFGIILDEKPADAEILEIAAVLQARNVLGFIASNLAADYTATTGVFDQIRTRGFTQTRCLFHGQDLDTAIDFAAAYASRGMSTNFAAAGTASTMHLKDLTGIPADTTIDETQKTNAGNAGVDIIANFGVPKVFTSGLNRFFDSVYHLLVTKVRLQIAYFNFLGQTSTKIPQTEAGLSAAKTVIRGELRDLVTAGVFASGRWNSAETIGNPEDHRRNIAEQGFYIFSQPVADQLQSQRAARIAPPIQVAAKESGAIHSADVIISIEQ